MAAHNLRNALPRNALKARGSKRATNLSSVLRGLRVMPLLILAFSSACSIADDWPQWRGPTRDGVWREKGLVEKFDEPDLKIQWRVPISNGYSGPTVANGRVYLTDRVTDPKPQE